MWMFWTRYGVSVVIWVTSYPDRSVCGFLQSFQAVFRRVRRLGHNRSNSIPFQFVLHLQSVPLLMSPNTANKSNFIAVFVLTDTIKWHCYSTLFNPSYRHRNKISRRSNKEIGTGVSNMDFNWGVFSSNPGGMLGLRYWDSFRFYLGLPCYFQVIRRDMLSDSHFALLNLISFVLNLYSRMCCETYSARTWSAHVEAVKLVNCLRE
jgi:hypothetical protein